MILLDTNLLTRMTRSQDPQAGVARAASFNLRLSEILPALSEDFGVTCGEDFR